jgi:hypothetical protein
MNANNGYHLFSNIRSISERVKQNFAFVCKPLDSQTNDAVVSI